jgi:hypothetical protein
MALNLKNSPTGVDKLIDVWQKTLYNGLTNNRGWLNYESYPRAYRNINDGSVTPEQFLTDNDYKGVLMDDGFNVTSFFLVSNISSNDNGLTSATISVIFQADLKKLYTGSSHRFDEELINDIFVVSEGLDGRFTAGDIARTIDEVYSGFDTDKLKEGHHDMQPYNVVRFDMDVNYTYNCSDVYGSSITCNIEVDRVDIVNETSVGAADGQASAIIIGDQGNLTFLWTTTNGSIPAGQETQQSMVGLSSGTYDITVTDDIITSPACIAQGSGTVESIEMALEFNGITEFVDIGSSKPSELSLPDEMSISAWIYLDTVATGSMAVVMSNDGGGTLQYSLEVNRTAGKITLLANSGVVALTSNTSLSINTWYHVAGKRTGSAGSWTYEIFLNAVSDGSAFTTANPQPQGGTSIGRSGTGNAGYFKGRIAQVDLFNTPITPTDVTNIYGGGTPVNVSALGISGHVGSWPLNEAGMTAIAPDESVNSNDGALTGFSFVTSPWIPWP